jgi:hypothetical protein
LILFFQHFGPCLIFILFFFLSCVYSGPAGPQGQLRGPYPGSSPPGQQMRGPMMANNSGPTGGQQPRPPYFAANGGPTSNQGPAIRGPAGIVQQYPFVFSCVLSASNCVLVVMSLVRVDSVKKSKKKLAGEILNHPPIPFISLGFSLSFSVCVLLIQWWPSHTHTQREL